VAAELARQPLRQEADQRVGQRERVDAEVEQPHCRRGRRVRVQRREHEVPGHRPLDGDLGGLLVAHLADHDHVGVGACANVQPMRGWTWTWFSPFWVI